MRPAIAQPVTAPPVSDSAALIVSPIRLVVGWTFFSAFWRRVALADELDPNAHGYIGEKFNHFLPHALAIKPMIEYLVTRPGELQVAMSAWPSPRASVGILALRGGAPRLNVSARR
jgi:thiosulfate dehydrogenase [quinone] large subunit